MASPKMLPTDASIKSFLEGVSEDRRSDSYTLIKLMQKISDEKPVMWGSSIIGFGSVHYKYESGHEGDMPVLSFSPRKSNITVYFEGFDQYGGLLDKLGKHKISKACLYINKLADIDLSVLEEMLRQSFIASAKPKLSSVEEYISSVPHDARPAFDELRSIVTGTAPHAKEVLSYGIVGYKVDDRRARVYISGWKDHVAIYPVPSSEDLQVRLKPYIKGKGTIWFKLDEPLPRSLIEEIVKSLIS